MKISDLISELQRMKLDHGDLEVKENNAYIGMRDYPGPDMRFLCILEGRKRKMRYWHSTDREQLKGSKVCAI